MKKSTIYAITLIILLTFLSIMFSSCSNCSQKQENTNGCFNKTNKTVTLMDYNGDTIKTWSGDIRFTGYGEFTSFYIDENFVYINGGILVTEERK